MKCPADISRDISFLAETTDTQDRAKHQFRQQFKRSLSQCIRHGFSIEECFGLIWEEILEKIRLPEETQSEVYDELITWAKRKT